MKCTHNHKPAYMESSVCMYCMPVEHRLYEKALLRIVNYEAERPCPNCVAMMGIARDALGEKAGPAVGAVSHPEFYF